MEAHPFDLRIVRELARLAACVYPRAWREAHRLEFADVAEHLWRRERARRTSWRATITVIAILVDDTITSAPAAWFSAVRGAGSLAEHDGTVARRASAFLSGGGRDVGLALRSIRRHPGFALLVVLTLGLGIGASGAAFDALDRTMLRPLPFPDAERLVFLSIRDPDRGVRRTPTIDTLATWRARATSLESIEIYWPGWIVWQARGGAEPHDILMVSGGLLDMLHVRPLAGRLLLPSDAEPGAPPVAMITEQAWRTVFHSDPGIIGRVLMFGVGRASTTEIVGVLPAGARIDSTRVADFLTPLPRGHEYPRGAPATILARMRPGVTAETVEAQLRAITPHVVGAWPPGVPDVATPAALFLGDTFSRDIWLVFGGALALFLIAIVNAGHLLLGRAMARGHELGVRRALGGSSLRLARLFVAEAFVYVGSAVALGAGVMVSLERLIHRYEPRLFMDVQGAGVAGRTLWFLGVIAAVATVACALAPLLRSRSQDLRTTIEAGGAARSTSHASRAMHAFNAIQAAVAVLLVVGAAVMARSLRNLLAVDSGVAIEHLVSFSATPPASRYSTRDMRAAYRQQAEAALQGIPTVTGVTTSYTPLLETSIEDGLPYLDGEQPPAAAGASFGLARVSANYFDVTGTRVIAGRLFRPDDLRDVAIVNETFAARYGGHVVGRLVYAPSDTRAYRIVGVVSDVKSFGLADTKTRDQLYLFQPRSNPDRLVRFFLRTTGDPALVIQEARHRVAAIDASIPIVQPETGADVIRRQTAPYRLAAVLLAGLAVLGLALALTGIYGAVALGVSRRRREIGIRMALGSTPQRVKLMVLRTGLRPVAVGGCIGVAAAWLALPYVEALLYQVHSTDPWSAVAGLSLVTGAAAVASWIPARRASRIDPADSLRQA